MPDLFALFLRLMGGLLRVTCYTGIFLAQTIWFFMQGRRDKVGDALGWYGKGVIDALATIARGR